MPEPLQRVRRAFSPPFVLAVVTVVWATTFVALGWQRHDRFATFGFDLGIYDQGIWLLSRFKDPFVTVRGLDLFGHHMNVILLLFVPAYWLGAGPHFLLVAQVAVQAAGVIPVYLLARDLLDNRWLASALGAVLLLHPSYQFFTWEYFHPDALAVTPLLFAYWAARRQKWGWFAVAAITAALCKEDVALALFMVGVLIAVVGHRRIGAITAGAAAVWFILSTRLLIPLFNGVGPFYDTFFGEFGNSQSQVIGNIIRHPTKALDVATRPDRMDYYRQMLTPVAFLPLAALPVLAIAAPMFAVNALSSFPYTHQIMWHYSALPLAAIVIATVEALRVLGRRGWVRIGLVAIVLACSVGSTVEWGPSPLGREYRKGIWPLWGDPRADAKREAMSRVPDDAAVTATYNVVPHMTHREHIYEWPNPWKEANWGVRGENRPDPATVDWLVLDRHLLTEGDLPVMAVLLDHEFTIRFERENIFAAQRVRPPPDIVPEASTGST